MKVRPVLSFLLLSVKSLVVSLGGGEGRGWGRGREKGEGKGEGGGGGPS